MSSVVALNPGAQLFWSEPADAHAATTLWSTTLEEAPPHLSTEELKDYSRAWLTAQAIKVDVFIFLSSIWETVWVASGTRPLTLEQITEGKDFASGYDTALYKWLADGDDAGGDRAFYGVIKPRADRAFGAAVALTDQGTLHLWAHFDSKVQLTNAKKTTDWDEEDEDGCVYARGVGKIDGDKIDLAQAITIAKMLLG